MIPNSGDIDAALIARLAQDPQLRALLPDGVFFDLAPPGSMRFVLLSLVVEQDWQQFLTRALEETLYQVEARALSTTNTDMKAAAYRIDQLLDNQPLTVAGYASLAMFRESRIRLTEADDVDPDVRWYRRGGEYRLVASLS